MKDIAIYGAGGFGKEVACMVRIINESRKEPEWNILGFFDDVLPAGTKTPYGNILGGVDVLNQWGSEIAVVMCIASPGVSKSIVGKITNPDVYYPNIISPDIVSLDPSTFCMGVGNVICSRCFVSLNVKMGDFNILNICTSLGHDASMGSFNIMMPGVRISGRVNIGSNNFMGLDAAVIQNVMIGDNVTIAAKSLLIRKAQDNNHYMGIPATKFNV